MKHFCTIITGDHLHKALALYDSLRQLDSDVHLHILSIDTCRYFPEQTELTLYHPEQFFGIENAKTIAYKYSKYSDKFRWSLKPIMLQYLLQQVDTKVIYLDTDTYFFGAFQFLFDLLDTHNTLLTPHHYSRNANKEQNWFEANFRVGLYNAGFVGVNRDAIPLMQWWASCCAYRCEKNPIRGTFDDQRYLDLLPVMDERVHILRHKGCNVADWNRQEIPRTIHREQLLLADQYPLIFIHFNYTTIRSIVQGREPLLKPHLDRYFQNLIKYKPYLKLESMYGEDKFTDKLKFRIWQIITNLGW